MDISSTLDELVDELNLLEQGKSWIEILPSALQGSSASLSWASRCEELGLYARRLCQIWEDDLQKGNFSLESLSRKRILQERQRMIDATNILEDMALETGEDILSLLQLAHHFEHTLSHMPSNSSYPARRELSHLGQVMAHAFIKSQKIAHDSALLISRFDDILLMKRN